MNEAEAKDLLALVARYELEIDLFKKHIESLKRMDDIYDTSERVKQVEHYVGQISFKRLAVSRAVERLNDQLARIIYASRYLHGEKWSDVAKHFGEMTERNVYNIHKASFSEFVSLLNEELSRAAEDSNSHGGRFL